MGVWLYFNILYHIKLDKLQFLKVWLEDVFCVVCCVWFLHVKVNIFTLIFIVSKACALNYTSSHVFCFSSCPDSWCNCKVSDRKHVKQYNYAWGLVTSSDTRQESTSDERHQTEENESWMNDDRMKTGTSIIKGKGDSSVVREWCQSHAMMMYVCAL